MQEAKIYILLYFFSSQGLLFSPLLGRNKDDSPPRCLNMLLG